MARYVMLLDTKTCIGCLACTVACRVEHNNPLGVWMAPVPEVEIGKFPDVKRVHLPLMCMHCEDPACVAACPAGAIHRRPDGIVVIDGDRCCGSGACVIACPHGAITLPKVAATHFEEATPFELAKGEYFPQGTAQKCDMCVTRIDAGLMPACVDACPTDSRIFGDLDDPTSEVSQRLAGQDTAVIGTGAFTRPTVRYTVDGIKEAGGGLEVLNLPFRLQTLWDVPHALEFLLLGIGGGLSVAALFTAGSRLLHALAALFVMAGGLVLVADLGRPFRFLMALRNQRTSWLSRGAVANFAFIGLSLALAAWPSSGWLLPLAAALLGVFVTAYPGLALSSYEGVRSWHTPLIPVSFVADGIAAGLGVAALARLFVPGGMDALAFALLALAFVRIGVMVSYVRRFQEGTKAMQPALESLTSGGARGPWRLGVLGVGFVGVVAAAFIGSVIGGSAGQLAVAAAGLFTVIGSLAAKLVVLRTGAKPVQGAPDPGV